MKLLLNGNQEIASLDFDIDQSSGTMTPRIDALGYRIEGPVSKAELVADPDTGGLLLRLALPDITEASILIEKEDVKKLKGLMNKDAIKFMIKAFM